MPPAGSSWKTTSVCRSRTSSRSRTCSASPLSSTSSTTGSRPRSASVPCTRSPALPTRPGATADGRQELHFSTQEAGKRPGAHAEGIDPDAFDRFLDEVGGLPVDCILKVKNKEQSVLRAQELLRSRLRPGRLRPGSRWRGDRGGWRSRTVVSTVDPGTEMSRWVRRSTAPPRPAIALGPVPATVGHP